MSDDAGFQEFVGKMVGDLGAAMSVPLIRMGEKFGLYTTIGKSGPLTVEQLAAETGLAERYLREWTSAQAVSGYIDYDPASNAFSLNDHQATFLANPDSPFYIVGAFDTCASNLSNQEAIEERFRTGEGISWDEQPECQFCATAKSFGPKYKAFLVKDWLPALDGVVEKLEKGARVADVGCGHGLSTIYMAEAFPNSEFIGFDLHEGSIEAAREHAKTHGVEANVRYEVALAKEFGDHEFSAEPYDLVCVFDCLHDMGDPTGAAAHIKSTLKSDGTWMIVEPFANDSLEENMTPVSRIAYSASTMICVPTSLSQEVGAALGAQAGEAKLREMITAGGFSSVTRAAETPFNMVLEARA